MLLEEQRDTRLSSSVLRWTDLVFGCFLMADLFLTSFVFLNPVLLVVAN